MAPAPLPGPAVLVAVCGAGRAGKDAVAARFSRLGYAHLKFAAPLKRAVAELFGLPACDLETEAKDAPSERCGGATPREVLQWLGTEVLQRQLPRQLPRRVPPRPRPQGQHRPIQPADATHSACWR